MDISIYFWQYHSRLHQKFNISIDLHQYQNKTKYRKKIQDSQFLYFLSVLTVLSLHLV